MTKMITIMDMPVVEVESKVLPRDVILVLGSFNEYRDWRMRFELKLTPIPGSFWCAKIHGLRRREDTE